ncbi:MAG: tetratricopeptide repeat protein [Phenylobacterium sp.]|uniref:tetratricopeptide repeat protein n=1 Tax=Phenylobacterium sp. TaxID=1871053 RepID=UPI00391CB3CA
MSALAATAAAALIAAQPALAAPWGKKKAEPEAPAAAAAQAPAVPAPRRATPEERAQVARLDPLARAAFWAREANLDPRDAEAGVQLSQALRAMGNHADALQASQRVLVVQPDHVEALLESARAHIGRGQGFYAIEPARRAQALAPKDWRAPSLLGVAYEQALREEEALAAHRQAVALAPNEPSAVSNLALFYANRGEAREAEALLRRAAAQPNAPIAVRQNLALVLGLQGRFDEAERLARQDLPPEAVANNLAWLRAVAAGGETTRSWDSLRSPQ